MSFHDRYPTSIGHELWLADHLVAGVLMRHGSLGARRRLRQDAGAVFARMPYHRVVQEPRDGVEWAACFVGTDLRAERCSHATTAEILTPARVRHWSELERRLRYRVGGFMTHDDKERGRAARVIRSLGYAVAESLASLWFFDGECSWAIANSCREHWHGRDQLELHRFPSDSHDGPTKRRPVATA